MENFPESVSLSIPRPNEFMQPTAEELHFLEEFMRAAGNVVKNQYTASPELILHVEDRSSGKLKAVFSWRVLRVVRQIFRRAHWSLLRMTMVPGGAVVLTFTPQIDAVAPWGECNGMSPALVRLGAVFDNETWSFEEK